MESTNRTSMTRYVNFTFLWILFISCLLVQVNYSASSDLYPDTTFTYVKRDARGRVYVVDGSNVRELYANMTFGDILRYQTEQNSVVKLVETFSRNANTTLMICSTLGKDAKCSLVDSVNKTFLELTIDEDFKRLLNENDVINSVNCDSNMTSTSNNVYICLSIGYACRPSLHSTFVRVLDISLASLNVTLMPIPITCTESLKRYNVSTSFKFNQRSYFMNTSTNGIVTSLLSVKHGDIFVSLPIGLDRTGFSNVTHVDILIDDEIGDSLVLFGKRGDIFTMLYTRMSTVEQYIEKIESKMGNQTGIHRSASVLEMNISPWQYGVPETRIDAFVVGTRHGQVIAFYTYLTAGNTRVFYKMKLGSNSFKQKWAEIENFGKERVLDMWINGDKLVIATEKKIRSLDIARCQYEWVDDCARDVECTLCSGNVTGYCIRNAACSKPASVDKLVMFEIDKISPQEGCPQSIVRVQGLNLDLAENITVTIHGEPAHIISPLSGNRDIEIRIPALNETVTNTTLTVSINNIVIKTFPFSTISCPYITEHAGQLFKTIRSGGTIIPFHVANYRTMDNSAFFTIEVAFLYNGSKVASARLHSVDKVNTNQPFAFYAPPLLDYVGQDLQLALAAPTYHLLDRDYGLPVLYGGVSNLTVKVYPDPVIIGVHDGDVNDVKKRVTYSYWDGGGKIFFAAKNLDAIQTSDVDITIEPLGKCTDVQIYRRANGRLSCELPWPKSVYRTARFDVIIKIGQNLIYHPGEIYFFKESRRTTRNAQNTTRHKTKTPNIRPNIHDTTVAISGTRSDVTGTSVRLEVIIPLVLLAVGILGCGGLLYCRFRKSRKRSPFRDTIDRDLPSVVSYRSNVGVFIGEPRPSFQGIQSEISSTDAFIPDNFEDSAQLIINSMEEEGLILKKRDLNIDRLIGRGNFGSVYKGYLLKGDDRIEIAVKTLQRDSPENMDITQFLKEAYVMKNFNHMNVMTLIGACLDAGDLPLVVLPYMKHGDLLTYLQEEEHIPTVKDLVCFGLDITLGMEYLASLKFVHRDLAARNCMLDVNYRVKVADFGLSRDIYETSYYSTKSKGIKLPVKWMAIESLAEGVFDEKTDVWSFGVTLWELMTRGVRPYAAVDNWDIEAYLTSGRRLPQPLFCPANLYKLMRKCWSHDPEDRPNFTIIKEWITELLDRVHHYLGDMEKTTDIENTYVNLSQGKKCKYENLNF